MAEQQDAHANLTPMHEVTVLVGGSVGCDPYSSKTWSGSSASLLAAMKDAGMLCDAIGIDVTPLQKRLLLMKNFHRQRPVWRQHYYADPAYRAALTRAAGMQRTEAPVLMQFGSMFSLPEAFPDRKCISYHDGNLVESLKSGFNVKGLSSRRVEQALRYEERVSGEMTAIFTFSEYLRRSFVRDYHVAEERVFNVGGGVNLTELPTVQSDKEYGSRRILFIGSDFKRKGGMQLLEAFSQVRLKLPDAELHIAGPTKLDTVAPGVVFHGHLSKANREDARKLDELFRRSSLFVLPSLYEPFGIAPLEAMLHGLPCVVTNDWALAEFVTEDFNGALVAKGSVEELAAKILALLQSPERMAAMGLRGRERVLSRYTWTGVVERMSKIIAGL